MSAEICTTLYGDEAGRWLLVRSPEGIITPPWIDIGVSFEGVHRLTQLGEPGSALTLLYNRFKQGKTPVQAALANLLGVSQQEVSRYMAGTSRPSLYSPAWPVLVRAMFDDTVVEMAIDEIYESRAEDEIATTGGRLPPLT